MKPRNKGFTLIELMVVVSIIIILASLAVPSFVKYREATYASKCVTNLRCIQDAREAYFMSNVGVTSITGEESAFLQYLGELTSSETTYVLVDEDLVCCPYNNAAYSLGVQLSDITSMPTCPNASAEACTAHVYNGH